MVNDILKYARDKEKEYLKQLFEFLSIPSVSTLPKHKKDVRRAAEWLENQMKKIGLENVKIMQIGGPASRQGGHPVVYGDWLHAKNKPTVLFYGHYDVQPVDPLDEWQSPPFKPEVRNGNIYARGADDNKSQHFIHLKSVQATLEKRKALPVNIKFLIEGEEELGSVNLEHFIRMNKKLLTADFAFISDTGSPAPDKPTIIYGLRGLLYTQITVQTAKHDLHSAVTEARQKIQCIYLQKLSHNFKMSKKLPFRDFMTMLRKPRRVHLKQDPALMSTESGEDSQEKGQKQLFLPRLRQK